MSLSNDDLSLLIRFHGDHELQPCHLDASSVASLFSAGLIAPTIIGCYRITSRGLLVTSAMRGAAMKELRETEGNHG